MGACQCKNCTVNDEDRSNLSAYDAPANSRSDSTLTVSTTVINRNRYVPFKKKNYSCKAVDNLILKTMSSIGRLGLVTNPEPPDSLQKLHVIGDNDDGWLQIINSLVNVIPVEDPLGPAVITVVLDDCPLPNRAAVLKLAKMLNLSRFSSLKSRKVIHQHRNICVILGVLAEKLPGPNSISILTTGTLQYLISNLDTKVDPLITLFSLTALEKFAQYTENKVMIRSYLEKEPKNPLQRLEQLIDSEDCIEAQVGFCARWCLDNLFPVKGRTFSYLTTDTSKLHAILNSKDTSEYLKLSADGLEARCDAYSFESVRCTFQIDYGVWYYEATVLSCGVMQIGWATMNSLFRNHEGYGIGDDEYSISYDGCRQQLWYAALNESLDSCPVWRPGDVVGCLINIPHQYVTFYLNGNLIVKNSQIFTVCNCGFFAAASFMAFQHCKFNFGDKPFRFPPDDVNFSDFNSHGYLSESERLVLPRHVQFKEMQNLSITEDSCTLCFDNKAVVSFEPCKHSGFCMQCSKQLSKCPVCRSMINEMIEDEALIKT